MGSLTIFLAIIALFMATGALLAVGIIWSRNKQITARQDGLFEELAALTLLNKRLMDRIQALENDKHIKATTAQPNVAPVPVQAPRQVTPEQTAPEESKNLWQDVVFLAKQGLSADTIARDLHITRGEVELILGLHNFKPKE